MRVRFEKFVRDNNITRGDQMIGMLVATDDVGSVGVVVRATSNHRAVLYVLELGIQRPDVMSINCWEFEHPQGYVIMGEEGETTQPAANVAIEALAETMTRTAQQQVSTLAGAYGGWTSINPWTTMYRWWG